MKTIHIYIWIEFSRTCHSPSSFVYVIILGTQACINAASTVSGIIGDLETTIMFATAGNLNPEHEHESFANHRENILKTAKALVEDTKTLVAGAASSQEQLAVAAQNSVATIGEFFAFCGLSMGAYSIYLHGLVLIIAC